MEASADCGNSRRSSARWHITSFCLLLVGLWKSDLLVVQSLSDPVLWRGRLRQLDGRRLVQLVVVRPCVLPWWVASSRVAWLRIWLWIWLRLRQFGLGRLLYGLLWRTVLVGRLLRHGCRRNARLRRTTPAAGAPPAVQPPATPPAPPKSEPNPTFTPSKSTESPTLPPAPGGSRSALEPARTEMPVPANSGMLSLYVPPNTKIFINGQETRSLGSQRDYVSFGLDKDKTYPYTISALILAKLENPPVDGGASTGAASQQPAEFFVERGTGREPTLELGHQDRLSAQASG